MNGNCKWFLSACLAGAVLTLATPAYSEEQHVVAQGEWTKKAYSIEGTWKLVERDDKYYIVLDENFKTKKAPDLKVFLSPLPLDELTGNNATSGSLFVGALRSNQGAQELTVPTDAKLDRYVTVIIQCEKYSKLWGGASLASKGN